MSNGLLSRTSGVRVSPGAQRQHAVTTRSSGAGGALSYGPSPLLPRSFPVRERHDGSGGDPGPACTRCFFADGLCPEHEVQDLRRRVERLEAEVASLKSVGGQ